jgi:hypothetical protein
MFENLLLNLPCSVMSFLVSPSRTLAAKLMLTNPSADVKNSIRNFWDIIPSDFSSLETNFFLNNDF